MNWFKQKWCDWFHGGGDIKRDANGCINWQCRTCGRWGNPVPKETERRVIDADLRERLGEKT